MSDLYDGRARPAVLDGEDRPVLSLAEECADRQGQCGVGAPARDMNDDPIIVPKSRPRLRRVDKIDRCPHPLFLDAERRDFEEARWIDARYPRPNWRSAPA